MHFNGEEIAFPAQVQFSFFKVIESLKELQDGSDQAAKIYALELLKEVEKYPELEEGISDISTLDKYQPSIEKFCQFLFPHSLQTNEIKALTPPFQFDPLYVSKRYQSILDNAADSYQFEMKGITPEIYYLYCCYFILSKYYNYPLHGGGSMTTDIFHKGLGISKKYKVLVNADLIDFFPTKNAKKLSKKDIELLIDNFDDVDLWKTKFPPNSWIMKGICFVNLVDVTKDYSVSNITSTLLSPSEGSFTAIEKNVRSILNSTNIDLGILLYENETILSSDKDELRSILLVNEEELKCSEELCDFSYSVLIKKKEPLIIPDVKAFGDEINSSISKRILDSGYKSYIIAPLLTDDNLHGFVEFGSKERYELNSAAFNVLREVIPIMSMAQQRFIVEAQNQIEAIIQQECTTIHPSVKWKFEEEANKFINAQFKGDQAIFKDIVFKDLYPLYGQIDIKGSSVKRNAAVCKDLIKQLKAANEVLKLALKKTKMPIYEELTFKVENFCTELNAGVSASIEYNVLSFLKTDVYPVFEYLEEIDAEMQAGIQTYRELLDPELMTVYEERKKYDTSVDYINQKLASFLDEKQVQAQEMFPHYFERYKTDGVEYSIYIGQSIAKNQTFDLVHLKNLRLWQLMVMCEMESEYQRIRKEIHSDIEMASLILVHNTAISVHFRMDEKQFDVEGAYNARYEIIKKRVDKANIKGSNERITQPGYISIVYSQDQDAIEYKDYLDYLVAKGVLEEGYEDLQLEDLQGVTGMKALRAKLKYEAVLTVEEFMESIERPN